MIINGKLQGIHIDLVYEAADMLDIKVKFKSLPWKRAVKMVKEGEADAITYISKNPERDKFLIYREGNILSSVEFVFLALKKKREQLHYTGNIEALLLNRTLITQRGYSYGEIVDQKLFKKQEIKTVKQMMNLLIKGREEIAIININDFNVTYKGTKIDQQITPLYPSILKKDTYVAFSKAKKNEKLAEQFSDAIFRIKNSPLYDQIIKKYKN